MSESHLQESSPERVYFIAAIDWDDPEIVGGIKVGVSGYPPERARKLQVDNPLRVELLGWFEAPAGTEKILHGRLAAHRLHGEWFRPHRDVLALLEECLEVYGRPGLSLLRVGGPVSRA